MAVRRQLLVATEQPEIAPDADADPLHEWTPDPDGVPAREAARVLLVNQHDEVLLIHGYDTDDSAHHWWFTVGGGLEPHETPAEGAAREVAEETGLRLDPAELVGPVCRRSAEFRFISKTVRQREEFFLARVDGDYDFSAEGWTDIERRTLGEFRWWSLPAIAASEETIYPSELCAILEPLLAGGWDGNTRHIN
ncbi:NUDIX domain-containing protein [Saxibacter everestensis]|uniref:NUDIX domain-containing protein n=1 Tax=Saxibacter everestensis TaxID=2909229 RepID=A0ABY8QYG9_9MICO|nr:NUDIX domain-containing protein [Brevibacteriaceae bacterium ZFBP1038]